MASTMDRREFLTCSMCLGIYEHPKLLPCAHTYCLKCLQSLALHHQGSFPCPMCRKDTHLPPEGVSGFPNNIHIQERDLEIARNWEVCLTHHDKVIEFYCSQCTEYICINCKVTAHEGHPTEDLSVAAARAKEDLVKDRSRLQSAVKMMSIRLNDGKKKQIELVKHQKILEKQINSRHEEAMRVANQERDKALRNLRGKIQSQRNNLFDEKKMESDIGTLSQLLERVDKSLSNNKSCELLAVSREMKFGRGGVERVKTLTTSKVNSFQRLSLYSNTSKVDIGKLWSDFLGTAKELPDIKMKLQKKFCCGDSPYIRVFSLCHAKNQLKISYEADVQVSVFTEDGQLVKKEAIGRVSYRYIGNGICNFFKHSELGHIRTYTKTTSPHFFLLKKSSGKAQFYKTVVKSLSPYTRDTTMEFSIKVGHYRAVDVDDTEHIFIVLEEVEDPHVSRKVLMFRKPDPNPVDTYAPPAEPFLPSDVCFYKLGDQKVLLIADEAGNSIHVVHMSDNQLYFVRYLTPPESEVRKPTALNTDVNVNGRLWVACEAGNIITIEPE